MKKTLILTTMFSLPVLAGPAEPAHIPAPAASPLSVELGGTYRQATKKLLNINPAKKVDVYGPEITAVYALTDAHAITLRFGYNHGSEVERVGNERGTNPYNITAKVHSFYLMPGYRYTADINEKWSVFAGASVGVTNESIKERFIGDYGLNRTKTSKNHASDWSIVGTIEAGVQYHVTESTYLYAAYELYANKAEPRFNSNAYENFGGNTQVYHSVRAGVGINF